VVVWIEFSWLRIKSYDRLMFLVFSTLEYSYKRLVAYLINQLIFKMSIAYWNLMYFYTLRQMLFFL